MNAKPATDLKSINRRRASALSAKLTTPPAWLQIDLLREDATALEKGALAAKLTVRDYGKAILERATRKQLAEVSELPCPEGQLWTGNRWPVGMDGPLWEAAQGAAERHGLTLKHWAYSAIVAEIRGEKVSDTVRAKALPPANDRKSINRRRASALSAKLTTPPDELTEMLLSAALDAVEASLGSNGKIVLPLAFFTDNHGHIIRMQPTAAQLDAYGRAAHKEGLGLSLWIMSALDASSVKGGAA